MFRLVSYLKSGISVIFAALMITCFCSNLAFSDHKEIAPIPDDVVKKLLQKAAGPRDPAVERLRRYLDDLSGLLQQTESEVASINEIDKLDDLTLIREQVRGRFAEFRQKLLALDMPEKVAAWDETLAKVEERFDRLQAAIEDLRKSVGHEEKQKAHAWVKLLMREFHEKVTEKEASPYTIPAPGWRVGKHKPLSSQQKSKKVPKYLSQDFSMPRILYASLGKVEPPPTPAEAQETCNYVDADLGEAIEGERKDIQFTDDIKRLAQELEYSPIKIYRYVYDKIKFEPYYGSLKGAQGTLVAGTGNATDQASLLIALLRASNIPARYVKGQIAIDDLVPLGPEGRGPRWVGAKTYEAAAKILQDGGIPAETRTLRSQIRGIELDHVWVEACVPYGHYRGAIIDNSGNRWIPLDPSFKDNAYNEVISGISDHVSFDYNDYLATRTDQLPHEIYADQVEAYIKTLGPYYNNNTLEDVGFKGTQNHLKIDILPPTLPHRVIQFYDWSNSGSPETAYLPDSHRHRLIIKVKKGDTELLGAELYYPDIALKRISLAYLPDATSQNLWNTWGGDLQSLPAGAVNVKPVLRLEGIDQAIGTGLLILGESHNLIIKLDLEDFTSSTPRCVNDSGSSSDPVDPDTHCLNKTVYTTIKSGGYHALQAYAFQASDRLLEERAANLIAETRTNPIPSTPANASTYEATLGKYLHLVLLKYFRYVGKSAKMIGELNGVSVFQGNSIGRTASDLKVDYLFDIPFAVKPGGLFIDVKAGIFQLTKLDSTASTLSEIWPTFKLCMYTVSAYEHYVWQENSRLDAVSTVRGLQYASETGIPLRTLNLTVQNMYGSYDSMYNSLMDVSTGPYSMAPYKAQLKSYVDDGATVIVPRQTISYSNPGQPRAWKGAVYMVEDLTNLYITAIISGGLAGGYPLIAEEPIGEIYTPPLEVPETIVNTEGSVNSTTMTEGSNPYTTTGGDPVNMVTGNMYHTERDLSIKGRGGLPIVFERFYNSRNPQDGPLGHGWTHSFNHFLTFYAVENGVAKVSWTDGTGGEKFFIAIPGGDGGIPINTTLANSPGIFVTFQRTSNGTYTIREKNGLTYTFESVAGTVGQKSKLLSIRDRNGNALNLTYTGNNLTGVTDGLNRSLTITYSGGRIYQIKDWGGRTHQYGYDSNENLTNYQNPLALAGLQAPVTYVYYSADDGEKLNHAMKSYTLPRGNSMTFKYYNNGKVFQHYNTLGETNTFTYNEFRRETVQVNERGKTRRFFFDQFGNLRMIIEENGARRIYEYDTSPSSLPQNVHNRLSKKDPEGYLTQYTYDNNGNVTQITNPSEATIQMSYFNAFSQPGKVKDANGSYTLLKYDINGNLLQEIRLKNGLGTAIDPNTYIPSEVDIIAWTVYTYDSYGNILTKKRVRDFAGQIANPSAFTGPVFEYAYNDTVNNVQGLNVTSITRRGNKDGITNTEEFDTVSLVYDALGRIKNGITADWYPTEFFYDDVDRVVRGTDAFGNLRDYRYDENGNLVEEKLELVQDGSLTLIDSSSAAYDLSDRKVMATDAGGFVNAYQYDEAGNVLKVTNPDNYTLSFDYDDNNRIIKAYDQENHTVV